MVLIYPRLTFIVAIFQISCFSSPGNGFTWSSGEPKCMTQNKTTENLWGCPMAIPIGNGNHQVNDGISPISSGDIMGIQREYQENIMGTWWVYSGVWWYVPFCYSRVCNGSHTPCIDDLWLFPFSSFNGYFPVPLHQITRRVTYSRYNQWRSTLRIDWIPWSKFQVFRAQLNASSRWAKLVPMRCRIQISKQVVKLNLNFILIQTPVLFLSFSGKPSSFQYLGYRRMQKIDQLHVWLWTGPR